MARASGKIFDHIETFDELKADLYDKLLNYPHMNYMDDTSLEYAIRGLNEMDEKKQKQTLKFVRQVDRKLSMAGTARGNLFHKLPTVMAGCLYIQYFSDQIQDLTPDELIILARFSIVEPPSFYEGAVDYLGQDLLNAVVTKHFDYMFQTSFLDYAESKIKKGEPKDKVATYIREVPLATLKEETFEYERQILEEVGKYI